MRILMVTPYLPYPLVSGGQVRTYNLLKKISQQHEVTLFALIKHEEEKEHIPELEKYCSKVQVFRRTSYPWHPRNILLAAFSSFPFVVTRNMVMKLKPAIVAELAAQSYDLIHIETFYMMPNVPITSVPVLLVEQTIEYLGYEKFAQQIAKKWPTLLPFMKLDIAKIKFWETSYWRSCDKLVTVSNDDRDFIQEREPDIQGIEVVSNGVDMEYFSTVKRQEGDTPTILFVGTFHWRPNVEAAEFLMEKVWPLIQAQMPHVHLRIVGPAPTPKILSYAQKDPNIIVTGKVPDIRDEYARASALLAPVFSGKGTRYKVLEAMATETPVVGTEIAFEGINAEPEKEVLIANTAQEMADATVRLLQDPALRRRLAKAGKKFVSHGFSWDAIAQELLKIYQEAAQ